MGPVKEDLEPATKAEAVAMLREAREAVERATHNRDGNQGVATIHVNAGGVGVWVAVTCCLIMLGITIVAGSISAIWLSREFTRIDSVFNDLNDKDSVQDAYINKLRQGPQEKKQ